MAPQRPPHRAPLGDRAQLCKFGLAGQPRARGRGKSDLPESFVTGAAIRFCAVVENHYNSVDTELSSGRVCRLRESTYPSKRVLKVLLVLFFASNYARSETNHDAATTSLSAVIAPWLGPLPWPMAMQPPSPNPQPST